MDQKLRRFFGTDGVRGVFGGEVMEPGFITRLAAAAGSWFRSQGVPTGSLVVIGRDTRASGEALAHAVADGLAAAGLQPVLAGVVPTPAVAFAVRSLGACAGVAVTASHNPAEDNGVKFFNAKGLKLTDAQEWEIEQLIPAITPPQADQPGPGQVAVREAFIEAAVGLVPSGLSGWKIAVDCAHGAAFETTPEVLRRLGADLHCLGCSPDGRNINAGVGSQHPEVLAAATAAIGARLGLAHDGDADRIVVIDETGSAVDGDELLAILAVHALRKGRLATRTLVATVQSNLGLDAAVAAAGGVVIRTPVGDRYVAEAMLEGGHGLGGENSGHVIVAEVSHSGDGLAAALQVIRVLQETGLPLSQLRTWMRRFPQENRALRVRSKPDFSSVPELALAIAEAEQQLRGRGRLLARYSGTEPKLRLLAESDSEELNRVILDRLESVVRARLS